MRTANVYFDFETMPFEPGNYEMQISQVSVNPNGQVLVEAKTAPFPSLIANAEEYKTRSFRTYASPKPLSVASTKQLNPRRRPTELERAKSRGRGKAARKARRVGR